MNHAKLAETIYATAKEKGFWDKERNKAEILIMIISEITEGLEADRKDIRFPKSGIEISQVKSSLNKLRENDLDAFLAGFKIECKDTLEDELADACTRVLDTVRGACEEFGFSVEYFFSQYQTGVVEAKNHAECLMEIINTVDNSYDEYVVFSDKSGCVLHNDINQCKWDYCMWLVIAFRQIENFASQLNIDLEWHMSTKMEYNSSRPHMHGKKY